MFVLVLYAPVLLALFERFVGWVLGGGE